MPVSEFFRQVLTTGASLQISSQTISQLDQLLLVRRQLLDVLHGRPQLALQLDDDRRLRVCAHVDTHALERRRLLAALPQLLPESVGFVLQLLDDDFLKKVEHTS